jgi:hypothetical protein
VSEHASSRELHLREDTFERALHCWDRWLESIDQGRNVLSQSMPLEEMRGIARKALNELDFPRCSMFELYWLCCVFCNYYDIERFYFDKIIVPEWFSLPFGFMFEEFTSLRGQRIFPPYVWTESELKLWPKDARRYLIDPQIDHEEGIFLPSSHSVRKYLNRGRPTKKGSSSGWIADR